jgi:hypothetical protein
MAKLTGQELIDFVRENPDMDKSELVERCGYFVEREDQTISLRFTDFYEALSAAHGTPVAGGGVKGSGKRRGAGILSVGKTNGAIVVGSSYVSAAGGTAGDQFTVETATDGQIVLKKARALAAVA